MQVTSKPGFTPRRFGKYLLLERIGRGGMAEVFRARTFGAAGFVKECAIKKILANLLDDDHFVRMFVDEAKLTAYLTHANIVQIFDLGDIDGHLFIAMEYVQGKDLLDLLARSARRGIRIPPELALLVTMEMLKGLDYAHRANDARGKAMNIVHRDVSPSNILLSYDGQVKVGDFGIAKSQMQTSHTEIGTQKGKTGYMSPEQVTGDRIDHRSDLFAASVILFEMLTMIRLFKAANDLDVMLKIRDADVEADLTRARRISPGLADIIRRGLAKDPRERFQTGAEYYEELRDFTHESKLKASSGALAAFMRQIFADRIESEAERRLNDPVGSGGFEAVPHRDEARFRFKDDDGVIHGPMVPRMMEELLGSRAPHPDERISADGGPWNSVDEYTEFADAARPKTEDARIPVPQDDSGMGTDGADWESLAAVNPGARRRRPKTGPASRVSSAPRSVIESPRPTVTPTTVGTPVGRIKPIAIHYAKITANYDVEEHDHSAKALEQRRADAKADPSSPVLEGELADVSPFRILHRIYFAHLTGRLRLKANGVQKDVYFRDGGLVAVDSDRPEDDLGALLLAKSVISDEQLASARDAASSADVQLGEAVVALGFCAPHEVFHYMQEQLRENLFDALFWSEGRWGWWSGAEFPEDPLPLHLDLAELITQGVQERCARKYLRAFYKPRRRDKLAQVVPSERLHEYQLSSRAMRVVGSVDRFDHVSEIVRVFADRYGWREIDIYRTLYLLTELGVVRFAEDPEVALPGRTSAGDQNDWSMP